MLEVTGLEYSPVIRYDETFHGGQALSATLRQCFFFIALQGMADPRLREIYWVVPSPEITHKSYIYSHLAMT